MIETAYLIDMEAYECLHSIKNRLLGAYPLDGQERGRLASDIEAILRRADIVTLADRKKKRKKRTTK